MSVARDAVTEAPASFTTSTSFTHTPVGTPKGVLVFVAQDASSTDENGSISYGGVSLTKQTFAHDTATELLGAYVYFLGASIPTGAQTVSFSGWGASTKIAWVYTLTATADTAVEATGIAEQNQADPAITLTTGAGVNTYVAGMLASGIGTVGGLTAGANGTSRGSFDFGQQVAVTGDRDTNGTGGSITYDWSSGGVSDDVAMVAIAVKEAAGGGSTVTGAASLTTTVTIAATGVRTRLGAASLEVTTDVAASGTRTTFGAASLEVTVGITATAASGANTVTGAASLSLVASIAATGVRTRFGASSSPVTANIAATGTRKTFGAASQETTLTIGAAGAIVRFGASSSTYTLTVGAAGTRTRLGAASLEVTFGGAVTAAAGHAVGAVSFEVTVGIGVRAIRGKSILLVPTDGGSLTLDPKEPGVLP